MVGARAGGEGAAAVCTSFARSCAHGRVEASSREAYGRNWRMWVDSREKVEKTSWIAEVSEVGVIEELAKFMEYCSVLLGNKALLPLSPFPSIWCGNDASPAVNAKYLPPSVGLMLHFHVNDIVNKNPCPRRGPLPFLCLHLALYIELTPALSASLTMSPSQRLLPF